MSVLLKVTLNFCVSGMSRELENLILENTELLATKYVIM